MLIVGCLKSSGDYFIHDQKGNNFTRNIIGRNCNRGWLWWRSETQNDTGKRCICTCICFFPYIYLNTTRDILRDIYVIIIMGENVKDKCLGILYRPKGQMFNLTTYMYHLRIPIKSCYNGSYRVQSVMFFTRQRIPLPHSDRMRLRTCTSHTAKQTLHFGKGFSERRENT